MRTIRPSLILLFASLKSMLIFSQNSNVLNYLPADAKMIIKINPGRLSKQITWQELKDSKMFQEMMKDFPENGKEFLNDPARTGIDLSKGFFLVMPNNMTSQKLDPVFFAVPKDTAQIASMVRKIFPGKRTEKAGNGKLIVDKHTALAWNNQVIILTGDDAKKDSSNRTKTNNTELTRLRQLQDRMKMLLTTRQKTPGNETFASLIKEDGDLLFWTNNTVPSQARGKTQIPKAFGMLNQGFMRKGDFTAGVIKFENGKVIAQVKQYISQSMDSLYKKYPLKNMNSELAGKLPSGHPILLCSFTLSPGMLGDLYTKTGADKLIDSISKHKIQVGEILPAIKGDLMLAVLKSDTVTERDSVTKAMNGIQVVLAGGIHDQEKFKNLSSLFQNKSQDPAKSNSSKKPQPVLLSDGSIFVISLSQTVAEQFLKSSGNNELMQKMIAPYQNHPTVFIVDLRTVFGFAMQGVVKNKTPEEVRQTAEVLGMFDKLVSYGGEFENHSIATTMELILANKDQNSFKQFLNLLNLIYSLKPKSSTAFNQPPAH